MKNLIFISLIICLFSCDKKPDYYHGVVVDKNLNPLSKVKVSLRYEDSIFTSSERNGHFKLKKDPNSLSYLVFSKKGYKIDTVKTIWIQSGEFEEYLFLNEKNDTLILEKK